MSKLIPVLATQRSSFFRLLQLVNLTARPFAKLYERQHHISLSEWRVMVILAAQPGITSSELGELIGLDKMAISRAVRGLERQGRLKRETDSADRRRSILVLTPAGRELYALIAPSGGAREEQLLSVLSRRERETLNTILDKLLTRARGMPEG